MDENKSNIETVMPNADAGAAKKLNAFSSVESKIKSLLCNANSDFSSWPKPDPEKTMVCERGRHFFVWRGVEFQVNVLYFHYMYSDGSSSLYVPMLDLLQYCESNQVLVLSRIQEIKAFIEKVFGEPTQSSGITCAPPIHQPFRVTTRTGQTVDPESDKPLLVDEEVEAHVELSVVADEAIGGEIDRSSGKSNTGFIAKPKAEQESQLLLF